MVSRSDRPTRRPPRAVLGVLALGLSGLLVSACASSPPSTAVASLPGHGAAGPSSGPLTAAQSDQGMVNFARCLRSHGVSEPDPYHRPGHVGLSIDVPAPGPGTNGALTACNHFIAPIAQMKQAVARQELSAWLPSLTRYAQCMRSHDIAMLDPDAQGSLSLGPVSGITNDFGRYSPQFRTADSACRHLLPAAVNDDGTGP